MPYDARATGSSRPTAAPLAALREDRAPAPAPESTDTAARRAAGAGTGEPDAASGLPRRQPAVPHAEGVSEDEFRAAMARLAGGVVLITARDEEDGPRGAPAGMTATAFLSVSLQPPLALVSVRTDSRMAELLRRQPLWAASLLSDEQRVLAGRFAMKGRLSDRLMFQETPHTVGGASGAPLLEGALATVECRTEQRIAAGDHTLFIGRVLATTLASTGSGPLTYYQGRYRTLT